ncbi:MAG: putative 4-hydroxybenzoate polyprenyltransferase [Anaerolineales bacterium]
MGIIRLMKALRDFLELIKFEHTIFALPFAYLGMLLAAQGFPTLHQFLWITIAMAAARTVAMGFNRIADRQIDARNPRTASRPLVSGRISLRTAWVGTILAAILLAFAAWQLGPLPLILLPGALLFLFGYSFTKRFTWLSHYILGFTDGLAPLGAWVAVRGSLFSAEDLPAWLLLLIVTFWIGGFDLIYACQDVEIDRRDNLKSIPARFGVSSALWLSSLSHVICVLLLAALGFMQRLALPFWIGLVVIIVLFIWEHRLVKPHDLSRIDLAFFNINSYISVTLFFSVLGALWLR